MSHTLIPDTQAPSLELKLVGGEDWKLSDQSPSSFTMVIFYRGLHCPVCKNYLTKLNSMIDTVNELGFSVVVASMDSLERAEESKKEWGIDNLNVAYGLDEKTARSWGLYISKSINERENHIFCEPGLMWVRPDGRLYLIDIGNMPWARPDLETLLPKAKFAVDNNYPARGTQN